mmetsp:Transcript_22958/g.53712  ORF Transcript_22958/g.53712 Transcript_22958/m.53712 type:complete len:85 (+) Transcript_22958:101-355(+)
MPAESITKAQEEAQRYVDEHEIDRLVTKMMNALIAEKPEDPKLFMIKWLSDRCSSKSLQEVGLKRVARGPMPKKTESLVPATQG